MKEISFLIKPASSLCNMACSYCFYADVSANRTCSSMGIMDATTSDVLIDKAFGLDVHQINFCFQGGEPLLAGISYFEHFISYVKSKNASIKVNYLIQTNGYLLDDKWISLFKENAFLVGISLDGYLENHNKYRKDKNRKGTFQTIIRNLRKLEKNNIGYNILTVLTHELSKKPKKLYDFYKKNNFKYVQLIPCLPSLDRNEIADRFSLTPRDFSNFYKEFFDYWFEDYKKGHYISVTLFDNIIPMYINIPPQQCGMLGRCQMQFIVEGNGNIYPCDFYVLDKYYCGNIKKDEIKDIITNQVSCSFINEKRKLCKKCTDCRFNYMCHGNCKRLSVCYYDENMCGYKDFLEYSEERMKYIAKQLIR